MLIKEKRTIITVKLNIIYRRKTDNFALRIKQTDNEKRTFRTTGYSAGMQL